jgi:formylglycine-generating enzyme required for sulfatase activity
MKDSDDAATMLAYKIDSSNTNIFSEVEEEYTGTNAMTTSNVVAPLAAPNPILPKARPDSLLNIPIGTDVQMEFVWIKPLGIWVGKYEVTNLQFRRFKPGHKSQKALSFPMDDNNQPAVNVTWQQAQDFCDWLNKDYKGMLPDGFEFRLPKSSEWTAAARCGTDRVYPWGDNMPPDYGNYSDLTAKENLPDWKGIDKYNDGYVVTCAVQDSGYNEWGLYGMAGNVWEWCSDWSDDTKKFKVRHGASWDFDPEEALKIDYKGFDRINAGYDNIGFRVTAGPKE